MTTFLEARFVRVMKVSLSTGGDLMSGLLEYSLSAASWMASSTGTLVYGAVTSNEIRTSSGSSCVALAASDTRFVELLILASGRTEIHYSTWEARL